MYKEIVCVFGLFLSACTSKSQVEEEVVYEHPIDIEEDIIIPNHYVTYRSSQEIKIDGKALEKDWTNASYTRAFIDIEGVKEPKYRTQVKMLWDDRYLYVYAEMEEPHVWGNLKKHDAVIFYNNDFEVFIDPTNDGYNYSEIEVNALNTTWDLRLNKPYRFGGHANDYYEIEGLQTAVHIRGSLNDASDIDTLWSVEMAIPLEVILQRKRKTLKHPKEGDHWRINFSRVQWDHDLKNGVYSLKKVKGKRLPEYNWVWSNQGAINMHLPERWGYLEFSENVVGNERLPKEIPQVLNKQVAYALLQQIKFGAHKALLDLEPISTRKLITLKVKGKLFNAVFLKTHLGFEIYIENLSSKEEFVINEEGKFKVL
jgi:hypothetical protein